MTVLAAHRVASFLSEHALSIYLFVAGWLALLPAVQEERPLLRRWQVHVVAVLSIVLLPTYLVADFLLQQAIRLVGSLRERLPRIFAEREPARFRLVSHSSPSSSPSSNQIEFVGVLCVCTQRPFWYVIGEHGSPVTSARAWECVPLNEEAEKLLKPSLRDAEQARAMAPLLDRKR